MVLDLSLDETVQLRIIDNMALENGSACARIKQYAVEILQVGLLVGITYTCHYTDPNLRGIRIIILDSGFGIVTAVSPENGQGANSHCFSGLFLCCHSCHSALRKPAMLYWRTLANSKISVLFAMWNVKLSGRTAAKMCPIMRNTKTSP